MKITGCYRERGGTAPQPSIKSDLSGSFLRSVVALSSKISALSLSAMLLIGVAGAQTPHGPIVNGHQLQPTPPQLESPQEQNAVEWNRWNSRVQPDVDRLYDEIMRATTRP
jgi:hypothetical protein